MDTAALTQSEFKQRSFLARKCKSTREEKLIYISDVTQYVKLFVFSIKTKKHRFIMISIYHVEFRKNVNFHEDLS